MKANLLTFNAESEQISISRIVSGLIVLHAFLLPLSTTATIILFFGIIALWLFDRESKDRWQYYRSYPLTKPILILIALSFIGMFHTEGTLGTASRSWFQIVKLGIIPILAFYLQNQKNKNFILGAFVSALMVTIFATILKVYGHVPIGYENSTKIFKNHIVISYFMAISLFFLCVWCDQYKQARKILLPLIGLTLFYFIFLNTGRIGYIILYICFAIFAWHKYKVKGVITIISALSLILIFAYQYSDTFYIRMLNLYNEYQMYLEGKSATPVGARADFLVNSIKLFFQHPLIGSGSGSFKYSYLTNFSSTYPIMTTNPHNQ